MFCDSIGSVTVSGCDIVPQSYICVTACLFFYFKYKVLQLVDFGFRTIDYYVALGIMVYKSTGHTL